MSDGEPGLTVMPGLRSKVICIDRNKRMVIALQLNSAVISVCLGIIKEWFCKCLSKYSLSIKTWESDIRVRT